ncbi:MAG TPA: response regulator [Pyrinomonadaceae bacterium]|nr:response regulator [Pyrinomonadaceae bacterium]
MKNNEPFRVLCVDDDKDNLELMTYIFEQDGFDVTACPSLEECLYQTRQNQFSAIILDNRFGEETSLEVCREIRSFNQTTPIIFYSGEARKKEIEKALKAGGNEYLVKPFGLDNIIDIVKRLVQETQIRV